MSWEVIRSIGLIMFVYGGVVLFTVLLNQYFDPLKQDARLRFMTESCMWSAGDGLMIIGACPALIGIVGEYLFG